MSEKNRKALMNLSVGMSPDEVRVVMGEPQMVEQYPNGTVWYYRTGTAGVVSTPAGYQVSRKGLAGVQISISLRSFSTTANG